MKPLLGPPRVAPAATRASSGSDGADARRRAALRITIVTPAVAGSRSGNRVTANRWAGILRGLGHRVLVATTPGSGRCDVLVALHARKSADVVLRSRQRAPERPIVLALTGTDIYDELARSARARSALEAADRVVVLHARGARSLPARLRARVRAIPQSQAPIAQPPAREVRTFRVLVLAHPRRVKDPLRAALAVRRLPGSSRIVVELAGRVLEEALGRRITREAATNPRFRALGELSRPRALARLARSDLLVVSSRLEGGANVIGEAIARDVPILATRVEGNVGLLGTRHPGLFAVGGTAELRALLRRAETDPRFLARLRVAGRARRAIFSPAREVAAWRALLAGLRVRPA